MIPWWAAVVIAFASVLFGIGAGLAWAAFRALTEPWYG